MRKFLIATAVLFALPGAPALWAGGKSVTTATLATDQQRINADNAAVAAAVRAQKTAQTALSTDVSHASSDRTALATNRQLTSTYEAQLSAALSKHDYATAVHLQAQLSTMRSSAATTEADLSKTNAQQRTDQATLNTSNETLLLAKRQLGLDTNVYNSDNYYLAIAKY